MQRQFGDMLTMFGLNNHVDFPTHISVSSLDLVFMDLPSNMVNCRLLATVGSSDHLAVLTKIKLAIIRDEGVTRTNWLWDKGDWDAMRPSLNNTAWAHVLVGDVTTQVRVVTETLLLSCQSQTYKCEPVGPPLV